MLCAAKGYVISLYRSPSQSKAEFDHFPPNFEPLISDKMSQNPLFMFLTSDFNVRSSCWWKHDLTTNEGSQVDAITSIYGLTQLIREPTHILPNSSPCIDLIFINQINFTIDSGVHASLHPNCYHQIA